MEQGKRDFCYIILTFFGKQYILEEESRNRRIEERGIKAISRFYYFIEEFLQTIFF
jgi:hypothetical protein